MGINSSQKLTGLALSLAVMTVAACQSTPSQVVDRAAFQPQSATKHSRLVQINKTEKMDDNSILVKFKKGTSSRSIQSIAQKFGATVKSNKTISKLGIHSVTFANGESVSEMVNRFNSDSNVLYAEPNYTAYALATSRSGDEPAPPQDPPLFTPDDPMMGDQYAVKNMDMEKAWAVSQGSADVIVAILDTGVDPTHPELKDKLLPGYNASEKNDNWKDGNGHGTHCAGIAAAITNNKTGIAGVAPNVKVLPVAVLSASGSGSYESVSEGIVWAADNGAKVLSMSLGGGSSSKVLDEAVAYALSKDAMVIAAMGNSGGNYASYPAKIKGVMAVGASDVNDKRAGFSNYGSWISVGAPGVAILSTLPTYKVTLNDWGFSQNYDYLDGTSMATPQVAGLAGLVRSQFPALTQEQARKHIEATSDDKGKAGFDDEFGYGRVNAYKALSTKPSEAARRR